MKLADYPFGSQPIRLTAKASQEKDPWEIDDDEEVEIPPNVEPLVKIEEEDPDEDLDADLDDDDDDDYDDEDEDDGDVVDD